MLAGYSFLCTVKNNAGNNSRKPSVGRVLFSYIEWLFRLPYWEKAYRATSLSVWPGQRLRLSFTEDKSGHTLFFIGGGNFLTAIRTEPERISGSTIGKLLAGWASFVRHGGSTSFRLPLL